MLFQWHKTMWQNQTAKFFKAGENQQLVSKFLKIKVNPTKMEKREAPFQIISQDL